MKKTERDEIREFYKDLRERIYQLRMGHLFEDAPIFEDHLWDCRLSYDHDDEPFDWWLNIPYNDEWNGVISNSWPKDLQ